jgi:hypothetical protein
MVELLENPRARDAARALVPENGARTAAAELLRLFIPPADVDRVEAALDEIDLGALGTNELHVLSLAARLARGCEHELGAAVDRAARLVGDRDARGARELRGIVDAVVRGLPSSTVVARADACNAALEERRAAHAESVANEPSSP